jgi:hypothetical protein
MECRESGTSTTIQQMEVTMRRTLQLALVAMLVIFTTNAFAIDTLDSNREIWVLMGNDIKYPGADDAWFGSDDGTYDNYYWIEAAGGGLNQLHITNAYTSENGQDNDVDAVGGSASGEFWISTTGGRGYNDDIVLMISVKPDGSQLPANLSINIKSSGYDFQPGDYTNGTHTNGIDVTVGPSNFSSDGYALYTYKPGPGTIDTWTLPLYTSQTDFTNGEQLLFIDLNLGNIKASMIPSPTEGAYGTSSYRLTYVAP